VAIATLPLLLTMGEAGISIPSQHSSSTLTTHVCGFCIAFPLSRSMCTTRLPTAARARSRGPRNTQPTRENAANKVELAFPYLVIYSSYTLPTHVCSFCIAFLSWCMCTYKAAHCSCCPRPGGTRYHGWSLHWWRKSCNRPNLQPEPPS
jgi:hypothetical protein